MSLRAPIDGLKKGPAGSWFPDFVLEGSHNYLKYEKKVVPVACFMGILGYWEGTKPKPVVSTSSTDREHRALAEWIDDNDKAFSYLEMTTSYRIQKLIEKCDTASEAWTLIKDCFRKKDLLKATMITRELHQLQFTEGGSTQDLELHLSAVNVLVEEIISCGITISEEQHVIYYIVSLPPLFQTALTIYTSSTKSKDLSHTELATVLYKELRRQKILEGDTGNPVSAEQVLLARGMHVPKRKAAAMVAQSANPRLTRPCTNPNCPERVRSTHSFEKCWSPGGGNAGGGPKQGF